MTDPTTALREARDLLLELREDRDAALDALHLARRRRPLQLRPRLVRPVRPGQRGPALVIVEEDGERTSFTFDDVAARSDRLAVWLHRQGVRRATASSSCSATRRSCGISMLALIKLGAVLMPTTTAVGSADLVDRVARGGAAHVICNAADTPKFEDVPGEYTRIAVDAPAGWLDPAEAQTLGDVRPEHPGNATTDRMLLYFTSGTTEPTEARGAHPPVLPGRAPHHDVLAGAAPRRRAPEHLLAGLGQARLVQLLRPLAGRGDRLRPPLHPLRPRLAAGRRCAARGHELLRPADGLADAHQRRPQRRPGVRCARPSARASR